MTNSLRAALDVAAGGVGRRLRAAPVKTSASPTPSAAILRRVGLDVDLALTRPPYERRRRRRAPAGARAHHPVLQRAQRHRIGARAVERVAVDLADRRRQRPELGLDALGQLGVGEALDDLLARASASIAVVERERHEREAEQRDAAQPEQPGVPLSARSSGIETRRSTSSVGWPGKSVMTWTCVSVGSGNASIVRSRKAPAPDRDDGGERQDRRLVPQREVDQVLEHRSHCSSASWFRRRMAPLLT